MKKFLSAMTAMVLSVSLAGCGSSTTATATASASASAASSKGKIGIILVGDENEGYTAAHINGIKEAAKKLGITDDQIIWKYSIGETQECKDAALDLVDQGATLVISNSYGHQSFMQEAASENPDVTFVALTGDTAATSGLSNFKNAFPATYESRYVSGVVAGLKLQDLISAGTLTKEKMPNAFTGDDIKIGYVGAYAYAEVVSGYTAFYLGVKSIVPNIHMYVDYTNSWFDINKEGETANSLMAKGCVIISQHADSTGAPSAVEAAYKTGTVAYSVGYNVSMTEVAPDVALTSASNNWSVYYNYAFTQWLAGKAKDMKTDWSEGYETGTVNITELGKAAADGTSAAVAEVETAIKDGKLQVFDTSTFTVSGAKIGDDYGVDLDFDKKPDIYPIKNGAFHESDVTDGFRSAPYFSIRIDGIEESGAAAN